jgi:hypothetical protein
MAIEFCETHVSQQNRRVKLVGNSGRLPSSHAVGSDENFVGTNFYRNILGSPDQMIINLQASGCAKKD